LDRLGYDPHRRNVARAATVHAIEFPFRVKVGARAENRKPSFSR
jgi:hypothetical protein